MMTQIEAVQHFVPMIKTEGKAYKKFVIIHARQSSGGERIETYTTDGLETTNTTQPSDYIVKNPGGEEYILTEKKFLPRYVATGNVFGEWTEYQAVGEITAIKYLGEDTHFIAVWGEPMALKNGDMVATPDGNEVYRIALAEFLDTYKEK